MTPPSPAPGLRQRGGKRNENAPSPSPGPEQPPQQSGVSSKSRKQPAAKKSEWDYNLAIVIMTILAFATRFWKLSYPDQVVFDEVHFGKVGLTYPVKKGARAEHSFFF